MILDGLDASDTLSKLIATDAPMNRNPHNFSTFMVHLRPAARL